jgi:hypothetical protein
MEILILLVLIGLTFLLYFLPALIASSRKHPQATAIFVLNLLVGLSGIGWLIALVWAFIVPQPQQVVVIHQPPVPHV